MKRRPSKGKSAIDDSVKRIENNCEIIRRLARGGLSPGEMDKIGASLNGGKTLEEIERGDALANIFNEYF